jgi:hypothetical protein
VIGEMAIALVLLTGAGLMLNSFVRLMRVDRGFVTENVLALNLRLPDSYRTKDQVENFYRQSLDQLRALPGAMSVGAVNQLPLGEMLVRGDFRHRRNKNRGQSNRLSVRTISDRWAFRYGVDGISPIETRPRPPALQ